MKAAPLCSMKAAVAMLCVALSLVFAGAAAAGVVNGVQHGTASVHDHAHLAFSDVITDDHHDDASNAGHEASEAVNDDGAPPGHQPGHHHHGDAPTGFAASECSAAEAPALGDVQLAIVSDDLIRSPGSPGPERPPKDLTIRA